MSTVAIVDYGLCNLDSVRRAVEECGGRPVVTANAAEVLAAGRVILPGVGAFPEAMRNLQRDDLIDALRRQVLEKGAPFLGICLGMQLMATSSLEGRRTSGLGWIEGEVQRLEPGEGVRVPHVGWDEVRFERSSGLFDGVPDGSDFYFVHSYVVWPESDGDVLARTPFGAKPVVTAVQRENVAGVQFHPEKSQRLGLRVIRNFLNA